MGLQSDHESGYFEEDEEVSEDETQKIEDAKKAAETNKGRIGSHQRHVRFL